MSECETNWSIRNGNCCTFKLWATSFALCIAMVWWSLGMGLCAWGSEAQMKGPHARPQFPAPPHQDEASSVKIVFLQSIRFYQKWISPIGGDRCGFRPTCSRYGYAAIEEEGPVVGLMMTSDRLTRCNIWKKPGPDYILLPNGKLFDPVAKNLLSEQ